ncbi:MAG: hypothetical protein ACRDLF_00765 [Solirubrobacteraceae bacterium]
MNHSGKPSWERLLWWLIAAVIGLEVLAAMLPRVMPYLVVLAVVFVVVRLVIFYTDNY